MQSDDDLDRFNQSRRRDSTLGRLGREENAYPLRDSIMPIGVVCLLEADVPYVSHDSGGITFRVGYELREPTGPRSVDGTWIVALLPVNELLRDPCGMHRLRAGMCSLLFGAPVAARPDPKKNPPEEIACPLPP